MPYSPVNTNNPNETPIYTHDEGPEYLEPHWQSTMTSLGNVGGVLNPQSRRWRWGLRDNADNHTTEADYPSDCTKRSSTHDFMGQMPSSAPSASSVVIHGSNSERPCLTPSKHQHHNQYKHNHCRRPISVSDRLQNHFSWATNE